MTLPTSGPLSFTDIQTEFGGSNPIGLNEYYAGGSYVPSGTTGTYGAVPSSGQIGVQNFYGTSQFVPNYIENFFSTYLFTGNASTQTITNGINLATNGGMVWTKSRASSSNNTLYDTVRGVNYVSYTNTSAASTLVANTLTSFNSTGFTLGSADAANATGTAATSWTFSKCTKFFAIATFTAQANANQRVSHTLGSVPGMIIIKGNSATGNDGTVYHRSLGQDALLRLGLSASTYNSGSLWGTSPPTSTDFGINAPFVLSVGQTYTAYLFAHNAGGFGLNDTDNVISCGSYTGNDGTQNFNVGYPVQWVLIKASSSAQDWVLYDTTRGMAVYGNQPVLKPNLTTAEATSARVYSWANGFGYDGEGDPTINSSGVNYVYMAIRKGPMKVPTDGTTVFNANAWSGTTGASVTTGFPVDMQIDARLNGSNHMTVSRLTGVYTVSSSGTNSPALFTNLTQEEVTGANFTNNWNNTGYYQPSYGNGAGAYVGYSYRRAPKFFDEVCYTGNATTNTQAHNLTIAPEFIWIKRRLGGSAAFTVNYSFGASNYQTMQLTSTGGSSTNDYTSYDFGAAPTSTSVYVKGNGTAANANGSKYVMYLFGTCPGVSKFGTYTGNGTLRTIDCGFTGGARWVLIKRTDATGGAFYVWDTARGMVAGTDPSVQLNDSVVQVNANSVYTITTGFQLLASPAAPVNTSGGTYIYFAIA